MPFVNPNEYRDYQRGYQRQWPWRKANAALAQARRRARMYGLDEGKLTKEDFARLHLLPCAYCGAGPAMGADHITPMFRGGPNSIENLAPAHLLCNQTQPRLEEIT